MASDDIRFDVRLIDSRIHRGIVTPEEYAKHLASLPDDAENAEVARVHFMASYADKTVRR